MEDFIRFHQVLLYSRRFGQFLKDFGWFQRVLLGSKKVFVRTLVLLLSSLAPSGNCQSKGYMRNT